MSPAFPESGWRRAGFAALLVAAALLAYLPALRGGFIFDDDVFVTGNPLIHAPDGLRGFWFSRAADDYWPVTSTTFWLEWRLWGLHAAGYHATNVALHVAGCLLLWALLRRLGFRGAWLGGLIFALHPVNAESAAWITERKNLLALIFFLLSAWWAAGAGLLDPPGRPERRAWGPYALSLLAFVLALLSKSSAVVLPLVLLGGAAWRGRPSGARLLRLLPHFAVAGALVAVQWGFSTVLPAEHMQAMGWGARILRAGAIPWFYAGKALWPAGLCFDYGRWAVSPDEARWWAPLIATIAFTAFLWRLRRRGAGPALLAWGYFCAALLPVLGFVEVGFMKYSPVSDHFAHLAMVGAAALAGHACAVAWNRTRGAIRARRAALAAGAAAVLLLLGGLTWRQCRVYADAETLYTDTLARNPRSWLAHCNLGVVFLGRGQVGAARPHLEEAVRLDPGFADAHNNLGAVYYHEDRFGEAEAQFQEAVRLRPAYPQARNNLGIMLALSGRLPEAVAEFQEVLRIAPDYPDVRKNLAHAEELMRRPGPPVPALP